LKLLKTFIIPLLFFLFLQPCFALTGEEIHKFQSLLKGKPIGEKIAFWAEKFIGVPYDIDPLGEYVSKATIVADERVDCMYLIFRAVELALSQTPEEAIQIALEKRFHSRGVLKDGQVTNYDDRFEYGEDMIESGKWGEEVTSEIGKMRKIKGSRGKDFVEILPSDELMKGVRRLKSGDVIFFATKPEKRKVGEIVGHIGIIRVEKRQKEGGKGGVHLIHASGMKGKDGVVKKLLLKDYLSKMPFLGVRITRF
jgi:cell wall-associated NlpC family hydrolase